MSHQVGQGEKNKWLKLVYLSNVITWRGFGKTQIKKIIQKLMSGVKREKVQTDKRKRRRKRRKKKKRRRRRRRNSTRG